MGHDNDIKRMRDNNIDSQKKYPILNMFSNHLSWRYFFDNDYYIDLSYQMRKSSDRYVGVESLCQKYYHSKIIITGPTGFGKSTSLNYLYLKLNNETNYDFYYVPARVFVDQSKIEYEKEMRNIIENDIKIEGLILIDGFEEAFFNKYDDAEEFLNKIGNNSNCIWLACRPDFLEKISPDIYNCFDDIADITSWGKPEFDNFINKCDEHQKYLGVSNRVQEIVNNSAIEKTSLYCPLFATMLVFIASDDDDTYEKILDEYDLIRTFISYWFKRELKGKNNNKEHYISILRSLVIDIYQNRVPKIQSDDSVINSFLYIPRKQSGIIRGFNHREFLVYFIVDGMLNAALNKPEEITKWYSQTLYDEITNLYKKALNHLSPDELKTIYNNLFDVYKKSYEHRSDVEDELGAIDPKSNDVNILKLRNAIIFYILRLPNVDFEDFLEYADKNCDHALLSLEIAYGLANICLHPFVLKYAKSLIPDSEVDKVQRSWGLCFYGDVFEDGYTYIDDKKAPWDKNRTKKLNRLMINDEKSFRFRILDISFLYCYYASRGFNDCISYRDYEVIKNCDISFGDYSDEEKEFVKQKKEELVSAYKKHLIKKWIDAIPNYIVVYDSGKIVNEDKIMKQIEIQESVNKNLKDFWESSGEGIVSKYKNTIIAPEGKPLNKSKLKDKLDECSVLILTANLVEGITVTRCLMEHNPNIKLERIVEDKHIYQFAKINGVSIVHVWPQDTSSFTIHGSFLALVAAFKRFRPKYVFAIGVAFGADAENQHLGDVIVSDHLIFYDSFNKRTDGTLELKPDEVQIVGDKILAGCPFLKTKDGPSINGIGEFKWYLGPMLTGGTVLSDADEKVRLMNATKNMQYKIIGGEMEGSGIYFACTGVKQEIPFLIVKGICDWGVNKNGWSFVKPDKEGQDTIKDCVQAYACENAFNSVKFILSQIIEHPEQ